MMKIFIGEGRLGNQIFQFVAMRKLLQDGSLWTPNLRALQKVFQAPANVNTVLIPDAAEKVLRRIVVPMIVRPLFKWLRLGTYCHEPMVRMINGSTDPSGEMQIRKGLLPVTFVDGGFYQNLSDALAPEDFQHLKIRADVLAQAQEVVGKAMAGRPWPGAVMHVRRGDYVGYRAYGLDDVLLPVDYFHRAANAARRYMQANAEILVVTDDPQWCEQELNGLKPFTVVSGSEAVDFALLSMFPVSILSNSTFSLAAACVGADVKKVIGPKFWFGHSVSQWYPPRIEAGDSRYEYV